MSKENSTEVSEDKDVYINFVLKGEIKDKFLKIKDHFGLQYNMETFRVCVTKVYDDIFKLE